MLLDSNNESNIFSTNEFTKHHGYSLGLFPFATPEHPLVPRLHVSKDEAAATAADSRVQ